MGSVFLLIGPAKKSEYLHHYLPGGYRILDLILPYR